MTTSTRTLRPPTGRSRRRSTALAALGAVCAVVLAGCVKLDMAFTLHSDDTASGTVVYAIQDSAAEALGQDPEDLLTEGTDGEDPATDFGEGATSEPYHEGGYTGTRITLKNTSIDDLDQGSGDEDALSIKRDGDEFVVSGKLDLAELADDSGDLGDAGSLVSPDQIASLFDVTIAITFPGEVVSADKSAKVDGNTVTWTSDAGTVLNLDARGKATGDGDGGGGGGGVPVWVWILVGVVVLAVAAAVVLALTRHGRTDGAAPEAETASSGTPPTAEPTPPTVEPTPPTQPLPPAAPPQPPADGQAPPPPPA
ncbi:hypothetical protein GCM10025864_20770 [Luteimicrobium album]|uniref:LppM domain-containing protein n=1 Tax=Luteimicrobium album TaxID=1054550 RepID=A0ABQ6I2D2_9MICO|nr:hypothetical protein [Luteimicrobium album]GMA24318.1 hypothetical protein GCM10025864_20770 [Luteimicrobium album]